MTETISSLSNEEILTTMNTEIEKKEYTPEIHSEEEMEADNGTILIFESIDLDFSETCYVPFKKPLSLADLEKEIYTFIKNNRDIDTDSIINEFNSNDSWDILDILDSLEAKDKIE